MNSKHPKGKLCEKFATVVVLGLGGTRQEYGRSESRALRETIFGLDNNNQLLVLTNSSALGRPDMGLLQRLKAHIQEFTASNCDQIGLVLFGHSHGAKMILDSMQELCKELPDNEYERIKNKMALITLGGVTFAQPNAAKVVLNVDYQNDMHSKAAVSLGMGNHKHESMTIGPILGGSCLCCQTHAPTTVQNEDYKHLTTFGIFRSFLPMLFGSTAVQGHLLGEYVICKRWRRALRSKLGVTENWVAKCGCLDTNCCEDKGARARQTTKEAPTDYSAPESHTLRSANVSRERCAAKARKTNSAPVSNWRPCKA